MFWIGMALGKQVDVHIIVSKNRFPPFVFGKTPTQSVITQEKGSLNAGMDISGALGIFWLGFLTS